MTRQPPMITFQTQSLDNPKVEARIQSTLERWENTRYSEGMQIPKVGVDCIRFVTGAACDLYRRGYDTLPRLPADRALHDKEGAEAAMRVIMSIYRPISIPLHQPVEPGDIIAVGAPGGGPGHAIFAGVGKALWHVTRAAGVVHTGMQLDPREWIVHRILRVTDKHLWA